MLGLASAPSAGSGHHSVAGQSYERWVRSPEPWPLERRVGRAIKAWGEHRGFRFTEDARLQLVARASLGNVPRTAGEHLDLDSMRAFAHRFGWTDADLAAVALRVPQAADVEAAVAAELTTRLGTLTPNRFGVAARVDGDERVVLVLLSRQLLRLWPIPAVLGRGELVTMTGSVLGGGGEESSKVTLVLGMPDGTVRRRALAMTDLSFETQIDPGPNVGVLGVQLLVDRGRGPEVAAEFPVGVEHAPDEPSAVAVPHEDALEDSATPEALAHRLAALVLGVRAAARLALPAASTVLDEVAASHVADMRERGFFAHVSPRYGDLTARLKRRGILVTRALENLARARSVDEVLRQWLASPSHRANLLDTAVDALGVGVETTDTGEVLAALVLARRADEGDAQELASRALARINAERLRRGLPALVWDEELARRAALHSAEASRGRGSDDVVASLTHDLGVADGAVDVFAGPSLDVVTRSRNCAASFTRAGIGVVRASPQDARLWITVLYASD